AAGAVLCLAGEGEERDALERQAARSGALADSVRFLGRVDAVRFLHALDAFVLPSRYEGMPNVLLEAMAAGLACVGTTIGGTEDLSEDGRAGLLVPPNEVGALAAALDQLGDADRREALGRAARARIEAQFAVDIVAERYERLYRELMAPAAARQADSAPAP